MESSKAVNRMTQLDQVAEVTSAGPHAAGVRWDLDQIYPGVEPAREALEAVLARAAAFENRYRGTVSVLGAGELAAALAELGVLRNGFGRVDGYADLRYSADSRDVATKDLMDTCAQAREEIENRLRFFDLEWQALPVDRAASLTHDAQVAAYRHYLERLTAYAPHMRSEAEEAMLEAREAAAVAEWQKLFAENIDKIEIAFDAGSGSEAHTLDRLLAYARHPTREVRFAAYETAYSELKPRVDVQAACYNAIVGDRLQLDKIRAFDKPMQPTNLVNDLPDTVVDSLVESVKKHYPLAQRWFEIKARILGLPRLHLYDQYAPLGVPRELDWKEAWRFFTEGTGRFSPEVDSLLVPLLSERSIDAEPRTGKRGGAFCTPVAWGDRPFIMMNFTDDMRSVETLAHEAGHALHFILIGKAQPPLSAWMGLAMAEIASTFHEKVLIDYVLEHEADAAQRQILLAGEIEGSMATIFRQITMTGYEQRCYDLKASGRALTAERLSDAWFQENQSYYGSSVELPESYRVGWSYIPHFIDTRFYTYAYAFAELASMAVYARYREQGPSFIPSYLELLSAGGSKSPKDLLAGAGIDITQPDWLEPSFVELKRRIELLASERRESGVSSS